MKVVTNIEKLIDALGDDATEPVVRTAAHAAKTGDTKAAISALRQYIEIQVSKYDNLYVLKPAVRGQFRGYLFHSTEFAKALLRELRGGPAVTKEEVAALTKADVRRVTAFIEQAA